MIYKDSNDARYGFIQGEETPQDTRSGTYSIIHYEVESVDGDDRPPRAENPNEATI